MLPVHKDVMDFVHVINLADGSTISQFKQIEPFIVRHVVAAGLNRILVSADHTGIVGWNGRDKYGNDWRIKTEVPLYICGGDTGAAMAIAADGVSAMSFSTNDGTILTEERLPVKAMGEPVLHGGKFYVPAESALMVLGQDLKATALYMLEAIVGHYALDFSGGYIFLVGEDFVMRVEEH